MHQASIQFTECRGATGKQIGAGCVSGAVKSGQDVSVSRSGFESVERFLLRDVGADVEHGPMNNRERSGRDAGVRVFGADGIEQRVIPGVQHVRLDESYCRD